MSWQPTASIAHLKARSQFLKELRAFFYARELMEVDVPIFSKSPVSDVHLASLSTQVQVPGYREKQTFYAHTSPEYAMKRLLCAGSGDIFYLGKVFRDGDLSQQHQIEFTMLEWYRLGMTLSELMQELAELIQAQLGESTIEILTYQVAFEKYAGIADIFSATAQDCQACLQRYQIAPIIGVAESDKPLWEQLVMTEVIEPQLGLDSLTFVYHFPARDAALAQISAENALVSERFEVYFSGIELANGYHELQDVESHRRLFQTHLQQRAELGLPVVPLDADFLKALDEGLPDCCGVALGVDRLLMLKLAEKQIASVMPFGMKG